MTSRRRSNKSNFTSVKKISQKSFVGPVSLPYSLIDLPPAPAPRSKKINILVSFNKTKCVFQWLVVYSLGSMKTSTPCAQQIASSFWYHYKSRILGHRRHLESTGQALWGEGTRQTSTEHPPWSATVGQSQPLLSGFPILVHSGSCKWLRLDNVPFLSVTCSCNPRRPFIQDIL